MAAKGGGDRKGKKINQTQDRLKRYSRSDSYPGHCAVMGILFFVCTSQVTKNSRILVFGESTHRGLEYPSHTDMEKKRWSDTALRIWSTCSHEKGDAAKYYRKDCCEFNSSSRCPLSIEEKQRLYPLSTCFLPMSGIVVVRTLHHSRACPLLALLNLVDGSCLWNGHILTRMYLWNF